MLDRRVEVAGSRLPEHTLPIHRVGFFSVRDEDGTAVELVYTAPGTALRLPYHDTMTFAVTGEPAE